MKFSLIIPAYKEEKRIENTAARLTECLAQKFGDDYEIIFVNDGSPDGTKKVLSALTDPHIRAEGYEVNRGKGYAVRYGMLRAQGDICIFTDCDLAYGTDAILEMYDKMLNDSCDICVASRRLHPEGYAGYSFGRRVMSAGYFRLLRLICGLRVSDSQSGLKGFSRDAAQKVFSLCEVDRFAFDLEVLMIADRKGYKIDEMPARVIQNGESSIKTSDPFRMLKDMIKIKHRVRKTVKK